MGVARHLYSVREIYALLLGRKGEGKELPLCTLSQLPSAQNNQYAKVAYFGVVIPSNGSLCSFIQLPSHLWPPSLTSMHLPLISRYTCRDDRLLYLGVSVPPLLLPGQVCAFYLHTPVAHTRWTPRRPHKLHEWINEAKPS